MASSTRSGAAEPSEQQPVAPTESGDTAPQDRGALAIRAADSDGLRPEPDAIQEAPRQPIRTTVRTNVTVAGMTPEAADAYKEIARYTHGVPAQERTNRAKEETKRFTWDRITTSLVALVLTWVAFDKLAGGDLVLAIVAIASCFAGVEAVKALRQRRRDDEQSK